MLHHFLNGVNSNNFEYEMINETKEELKNLYSELSLSLLLAEKDHEKNKKILDECKELGEILTS